MRQGPRLWTFRKNRGFEPALQIAVLLYLLTISALSHLCQYQPVTTAYSQT